MRGWETWAGAPAGSERKDADFRLCTSISLALVLAWPAITGAILLARGWAWQFAPVMVGWAWLIVRPACQHFARHWADGDRWWRRAKTAG